LKSVRSEVTWAKGIQTPLTLQLGMSQHVKRKTKSQVKTTRMFGVDIINFSFLNAGLSVKYVDTSQITMYDIKRKCKVTNP